MKFAVWSKGENPVTKEEIPTSRETATSSEGMAGAAPRVPTDEPSSIWRWDLTKQVTSLPPPGGLGIRPSAWWLPTPPLCPQVWARALISRLQAKKRQSSLAYFWNHSAQWLLLQVAGGQCENGFPLPRASPCQISHCPLYLLAPTCCWNTSYIIPQITSCNRIFLVITLSNANSIP